MFVVAARPLIESSAAMAASTEILWADGIKEGFMTFEDEGKETTTSKAQKECELSCRAFMHPCTVYDKV